MMERDALLRLIDQAADEGWKELDLAGMGLTELPEEIGKLGRSLNRFIQCSNVQHFILHDITDSI
jgi:hypothetical protein